MCQTMLCDVLRWRAGRTGVADREAGELARGAVGVAAARDQRLQQAVRRDGLVEEGAVPAQVAHQVGRARAHARLAMPQQRAHLAVDARLRASLLTLKNASASEMPAGPGLPTMLAVHTRARALMQEQRARIWPWVHACVRQRLVVSACLLL